MYNNYIKGGGGLVQTGILSQYVNKRSLHHSRKRQNVSGKVFSFTKYLLQ